MRALIRAAAWVALLAVVAAAQTVTVYSEFTRIDPFGKVVRADRGAAEPREILSPGAARGALSSFRVVVEGDPLDSYTFQVAQNPENSVQVTTYRERYVKSGEEWIPDGLEQVTLPYEGKLMDPDIPRQTAQSFWVDMWVDRNAKVERIKVEPQVYIGGGWVRYPMEVRITQAALGGGRPGVRMGAESLAEPSSVSAVRAWVSAACAGATKAADAPEMTVRNLIARNAAQDVRFAAGAPPPPLLRALGLADRAAFCKGAAEKGFASPEDYLRIRDVLISARE